MFSVSVDMISFEHELVNKWESHTENARSAHCSKSTAETLKKTSNIKPITESWNRRNWTMFYKI